MRIMMTIDVGMCSTRLMHYAVLHDVGEMAGDIPWPGKRNDPELKNSMDRAERTVRFNMYRKWRQPRLPELSDMEQTFFKMCENIEMWEFGLQEQSMGNKYGAVIAARMLLVASELMGKMPEDVQKSAREYVRRREEQERETNTIVRDNGRSVELEKLESSDGVVGPR
jgi:5'-deoxynucleotidase YfbR-like HD superfamily hydrolase